MIKTLINSFRYPRRGPGMMWEACAEKTKAMGGQIEMGCKVTGCAYDEKARDVDSFAIRISKAQTQTLEAEHVISSAPMRELARGLTPPVSERAQGMPPRASSIATSSPSC